mmetsp:Transcript_960/g.3147  ORF Transcript_960/g.3147 Transcript_960/m.3147 type:complete len:278 (-) Transcript_960:2364-3197(-)
MLWFPPPPCWLLLLPRLWWVDDGGGGGGKVFSSEEPRRRNRPKFRGEVARRWCARCSRRRRAGDAFSALELRKRRPVDDDSLLEWRREAVMPDPAPPSAPPLCAEVQRSRRDLFARGFLPGDPPASSLAMDWSRVCFSCSSSLTRARSAEFALLREYMAFCVLADGGVADRSRLRLSLASSLSTRVSALSRWPRASTSSSRTSRSSSRAVAPSSAVMDMGTLLRVLLVVAVLEGRGGDSVGGDMDPIVQAPRLPPPLPRLRLAGSDPGDMGSPSVKS